VPPEYIPLVTLLIGLVFQPIKDGASGVYQSWRGAGERRRVFQYDTLTGLATALETWRSTSAFVLGNPEAAKEQVEAQERVRILTFRVADDDLRGDLERLLAVGAPALRRESCVEPSSTDPSGRYARHLNSAARKGVRVRISAPAPR
jgi:hypothetical protein